MSPATFIAPGDLTFRIEARDLLDQRASNRAEIFHFAVFPEKWMHCGQSGAGVDGGIRERLPCYLAFVIHIEGHTVSSGAQGSQDRA